MNELMPYNEYDLEFQKNIYFSIGNNKYALPLANVLAVTQLPKLDYPQKLPSNFVGVMNFNNMVLNVMDIRFYLNMEVNPYSVSNKLIIAKTDEAMFGIIVDEILNITDFANSKIERLPFISNTQIIESIYSHDGENISIINAYALEKIIKNGYPDAGIDVCSLFPKDKESLQIFQSRSQILSQRVENAVIKNIFSDNKFLSFKLNNTVYCIKLKYVKEITNASNILSIPCSADYIQGLMTIRGDFITVLNLKKFLNFANAEIPMKSKVIVINSSDFKLGFLADDIEDMIDVPEECINAKNLSLDDAFVEAEIIQQNNVMFVLNMEKILSDEKLYIDEN